MTALRDRFGSIGARLGPGAGGAARGFFGWWGRALASWLPLRLRQVLGLDRGRLLLQADADTVQLRLQQGESLVDLGQVPGSGAAAGVDGFEPGRSDARLDNVRSEANRAEHIRADRAAPPYDPLAGLLAPRVAALPRWLLLPAGSSLRRRLTLPAAAADRLRDVIGFEIDRQTPFSADAVAFDARVLGRRESDGQLDVELVAVPRTAIDPQLAALGPLAGTLSGIDVAGADGAPLAVNLLAPDRRHRRRDPWRRWNWALAAAALVACAAMLGQVLANRRDAADAFEQLIAAKADTGRRAAAQRQQLIDLIEGQVFLDSARVARPSAVEVLDELARRLPDGTYLEKLSLEDQRLTLIGLSNEAPALIGRLQGSELWRSPALAGALQPDPSSGRDRFTLTAELGRATPAPAAAARGGAPDASTTR